MGANQSSGAGDGGGASAAAAAAAAAVPKTQPKIGKSGKKICCSCPETKKARDLCLMEKGEERCKELIEAHNECLRAEGFIVN